MTFQTQATIRFLALALILASAFPVAAVSPEEAAKLKKELTPFGAERAGNKAGTIPAWTGGFTPTHDGKSTFRSLDPYPGEKPLYVITAKNMDQYADRLNEGTKALLKKYPYFRVDVYPTHRSAAAPQWVYDYTFKNATHAKLVDGPSGPQPDGAFGGIPFPIPKSGLEAIWNQDLRWRSPNTYYKKLHNIQVTADGRQVLSSEATNEAQLPYYVRNGESAFNGEYWFVRSIQTAPPIRAGENIVGRLQLSGIDQTWVYLTGQRRVRKLPNPCCDTPAPFAAGVISFDEVTGFTGNKSRFDWKLAGKKELFVPYNNNRFNLQKKDADLITGNTLNPDYVRWELHRVWILEATLKAGQRHTSPKSIYYLDEDTWAALLTDRWDANGQLARTAVLLPYVAPELPGNLDVTFGVYDLLGGTQFFSGLFASSPVQTEPAVVPTAFKDTIFTPDGLVGDSVR